MNSQYISRRKKWVIGNFVTGKSKVDIPDALSSVESALVGQNEDVKLSIHKEVSRILVKRKNSYYNDLKFLKSLSKDKSLVITKADKGQMTNSGSFYL